MRRKHLSPAVQVLEEHFIRIAPELAPTVPPSNEEPLRARKLKRKPSGMPPASVFICEISANAFHFNMRRRDTEFFQTSIYEIDRILQERYEPEDPDIARLISERLPKQYQHLKSVFSKKDADT